MKTEFLFFSPPIFADGMIPRAKIIDDSGQGKEIPKGIHCVASYLHSKGIGAKVVVVDSFFPEPVSDPGLFWERVGSIIVQKVEAYDPRFIGFSLMFGFMEKTVLEMARFTKLHFPDKVIVIGGNQASFVADRILSPKNKNGVDIVVRGEGEWATEEIARGKKWDEIKGISFANGDGRVAHNDPREKQDLSSLPPNNFDLLDIDPRVELRQFNYMVQYVRGCNFRCAFCTNEKMWGACARPLNQRTFCLELFHVLDLIERNDPMPAVIFMDDDVMAIPRYRQELFSILKDARRLHPRASFVVQARVGSVCKNNLATMRFLKEARESGIMAIFLGIETGSQKILDAMNKKCRAEWIESACRNIKSQGMLAGGFWMFGHPGADEEEEKKSLRLLERLLSQRLLDVLEMHMTIPFPGTRMREDPRVRILVPEEEEPDHYSIFGGDPIHALIDPKSGRVVMSPRQIRKAYQEGLRIKEKYLGISGDLVNFEQISV